jgi:alkylation response protein AidB-like acyl-CoA dehydrogenase
MFLRSTSDQDALLDFSRRFIEDTMPLQRVRELSEGAGLSGPAELPRDHLRGAGELGWFAMFVPEDLGGGSVSGDGLLDAVLLARLRGGYLQPEPFVGTNTVAAVLAHTDDVSAHADLLGALVAGEASATISLAGDALWESSPRLHAERVGGDHVISGQVVVDDPAAEWTLVTAASAQGPVQALVARSEISRRARIESLDLTRRPEVLHLEGVRVPESALLRDAVDRTRAVATLLRTADSVGVMTTLLARTRDYALDRIAFGRPIGSFQAIKHLLADLSVTVQASTAALASAVRHAGRGEASTGEVASIVSVYVAERAVRLSQDCLQVHGGIGFAWEHDLHYFMRRLATNAAVYGTAQFHRELIWQSHSRRAQEPS